MISKRSSTCGGDGIGGAGGLQALHSGHLLALQLVGSNQLLQNTNGYETNRVGGSGMRFMWRDNGW